MLGGFARLLGVLAIRAVGTSLKGKRTSEPSKPILVCRVNGLE
jgi:hypothetical protein